MAITCEGIADLRYLGHCWDMSITRNHPFFQSPPQSVSTPTATVSYRKLGHGPPIVLIHGWPLHSATYRDVAAKLSSRYTCYVLDLPGAGASPAYPRWFNTIEQHTQTVLAFVEALGLGQVSLLGHDTGGLIARHAAAVLGPRVVQLVVSDTEITGHMSPVFRRMVRFSRVPGSGLVLACLLQARWFIRSRLGFAGAFAKRALLDGEFRHLFLTPLRTDSERFRSSLAFLRSLDTKQMIDLKPVHAKITAPTRFVWGPDDPFFSIERARSMGKELPFFTGLVPIAQGALLCHEEFPDAFVVASGLLDPLESAGL